MSLEQAIRQRWSADAALAAVVPLSGCFTGAAFGDAALPYVVVTRGEARATARTSGGAVVSRERVRFGVWTADWEQGQAIVAEIERLFDRAAFDAGDAAVLTMDWVQRGEEFKPDGVWHLTTEFDVLAERRCGASG